MRPRRRGEHMIKQTYSVLVQIAGTKKKWHLSSSLLVVLRGVVQEAHDYGSDAYWTQESLDDLLTVDDYPELRSLDVPPSTYLCARTNRMRETVARSGRGNPFPTSPRLIVSAPGLALAPLELLEGGQRFWREPVDEVMVRSLNFLRN